MKPQITVVTLGPGDPGLLTLQTAETLTHARSLVLRTSQHPVAAWLEEKGIAFTTLDALYERYEDFDALHEAMARQLWQQAAQGPLVYGVADAACDGSVAALYGMKPEEGEICTLAGVSRSDDCLARMGGSLSGIRILPASSCMQAAHHTGEALLITELDSAVLAGDVKLWLSGAYDDEQELVFFPSTVKRQRAPKRIPLWELDRQRSYDHTVCAYLPALPLTGRSRYCFDDLLRVMDTLRGEEGCPWDRAQTHESLRKYLIEEAWEVAAAIDGGDAEQLADELGDVLLLVVFHAHIGRCHGTFSVEDVTTAICRKMIFRHPHIFADAHCDTADEVLADWDKLKKQERGLTTQASVLKDIPVGLSALMRAQKVQKKAAQVGFDWDDALGALPKIHEEADEVRAELEAGRDPGEELGDLLFSVVNVIRLAHGDAEGLMQKASDKFIRRFEAMENLIISDGKSLEDLTLGEMDVYWNRVKQRQASGAVCDLAHQPGDAVEPSFSSAKCADNNKEELLHEQD